jgi:hypothetical protein
MDEQNEWDETPRTRWIQKLQMLDIDNRDELGREIPRVSKNNVYGKSGQAAGVGSGLQIKAAAYAELLGVDDIGDGEITVGKTFRFEARRIDRGAMKYTDEETGEERSRTIEEKADVPVEYFANGYTYPSDKTRPIWQFRPRNTGVENAADVTVEATVVATQDEVDAVLVNMFDGQSEAPSLQTLLTNAATKTKAVIDDVKSGAAIERLKGKGLLVEDGGKYVKLG